MVEIIEKKVSPKKGKIREKFFLMILTLLGASFLPVTIVLVIGMLPTIAAILVDTTREKTRSLTIGLMNFIGCFPFLMDVALQVQTLDSAYRILIEPMNITLMFSGAIAGYFLDWSMTGFSNVVMSSRAKHRLETIAIRQKELKRRWGPEVTGEIPLDNSGYPLHQIED